MIRRAVLSSLVIGTLLNIKVVFAQQMVIVKPEETDEILANPG